MDNDGAFGPLDQAYLDMDGSKDVSVGDIRLTATCDYGPNTKVAECDYSELNIPLVKDNQFDKPVGYIIGVDLNNNGIIDVTDPLYLDMDWDGGDLIDAHSVSAYDIRLTYVPVVDGPFGDRGDIGEPWSLVMPNDDDDGWVMNPDTLKMAYGPFIEDYLMIFDADCSGDWTCPDKIYLQQPHKGKIGEYFDYYVTVGDFRMYMPPCNEGNPGNPGEESAGFTDVTVHKANQMIENDDLFLLDVRTQEEFNGGYIEGATLIPVQELDSRINEVPTDTTILVYCKGGFRSVTASNILIDAGYTDVYNMLGGIDEWIAEGYPVVQPFNPSESGAAAEARFDANNDGAIDKAEVFDAIYAYFADEITKDDVFEVITAYFSS